MSNHIKTMLLGLCLTLLAALPARAAESWDLGTAHCSVNFTAKHILSLVPGHFDRFQGQVQFDPEDLAGSSFRLVIDAASLTTGLEKRDDHLRSADFFDVEHYPEIVFQSKEIRKISGQEYEAVGNLTMRGVTRNMVVPFTFLGIVNHPAEECLLVLGIESVFTVSRLSFGVGDGTYLGMGILGEFVHLQVYLELLRTKAQCRPAEGAQ